MRARSNEVRRWAAGVVACAAVAGASARGDPLPPTQPAEGNAVDVRVSVQEPSVIRTYDVGDLVRTVPDYPLASDPRAGFETGGRGNGGGGGGGGQGLFGSNGDPAKGPAEPMDGLIKLVQSLVAPEGWRSNGGTVGVAQAYGPGSLVVLQTEANHKAIQSLLDALRRDAPTSTVIEVQAQWVLLTPEQLAAWRAAERRPNAAGGGEALRAAAADLLKDDKAVVCRATTVGFNGQTVGLTSGRTTTVVTAAAPVVGQGAALYDFQTGPDRVGVSLQVTPRFARDQGTVTVDVHSAVTGDGTGGPGGLAAVNGGLVNMAAGLAVATAAIGVPASQPTGGDVTDATRRVAAALEGSPKVEQRFRTTVRVRPGTPVIVGGMTLEPGKAGSRQLCLLIDARPLDPPAAAAGQPGK
jgi:hypothetical protein